MIDRCCISINEACDMRCRYCHFETEGRRSNSPSRDDLDYLLSNIESYVKKNSGTTFKIGIVGGGEPMLKFDLLRYIVESLEACEEIKFYTISNGLHLNKDQIEFFYSHENRISYNVSLDGYESIHDSNRIDSFKNPTFSRIMDNIQEYECVFGSKPAINCTVTAQHMIHRKELFDFFVDNGFEDVTFSKLFDSSLKGVSDEEFEMFLKEASECLNIRQIRHSDSFDCCKYGKRCGVGRTNVYFASGKTYPCARFAGMEEYKLGSWQDSLDIIESKLSKYIPVQAGFCYYDTKVKME